jgi:hypothetical protein
MATCRPKVLAPNHIGAERYRRLKYVRPCLFKSLLRV